MKKALMTIAAVACAASFVSAQTVTSANIVGYTKVTKVGGGLQLVGINFGDSSTTLNDLLDKSQFKGSAMAASADKLYMFDTNSQSYVVYGLYDDTAYGGSTIEWRAVNNFYGSEANPVLPPGTGIFMESVEATNKDILISGEVPTAQYVTNQIVTGLQLVAMPFSCEMDLNSDGTGLKAAGATGSAMASSADKIYVWDSASQSYVVYGLYDDTAYGGSTRQWRPVNNFYSDPGAIKVDLGAGFWYEAQSAFMWVAENPYYNNL